MDEKTLYAAIAKVCQDYPRTTRLMSTSRTLSAKDERRRRFSRYVWEELKGAMPKPTSPAEGGSGSGKAPSSEHAPSGPASYDAPTSAICTCRTCRLKLKAHS